MKDTWPKIRPILLLKSGKLGAPNAFVRLLLYNHLDSSKQ